MCSSENSLCHLLFDEENRQQLIKALAAAFRWKAHYHDKHYTGDDENMIMLSQLLEELAHLNTKTGNKQMMN